MQWIFQFLTYSFGVGEDKSEYSYHGMRTFSVYFLTGSLIESERRIQSSNIFISHKIYWLQEI
jgi:hypothetical protein